MSGGQTVASGTAASGLYASNLNGSLLSVQYRTHRQVTPFHPSRQAANASPYGGNDMESYLESARPGRLKNDFGKVVQSPTVAPAQKPSSALL
jgi:hypothetical protein